MNWKTIGILALIYFSSVGITWSTVHVAYSSNRLPRQYPSALDVFMTFTPVVNTISATLIVILFVSENVADINAAKLFNIDTHEDRRAN